MVEKRICRTNNSLPKDNILYFLICREPNFVSMQMKGIIAMIIYVTILDFISPKCLLNI